MAADKSAPSGAQATYQINFVPENGGLKAHVGKRFILNIENGLSYNQENKRYQVACIDPIGYFPYIDNLVDGNEEFNVWLVTQKLLMKGSEK